MYKYPSTKKMDVIENLHGTEIVDSYRWLENNQDEEVKNWDKSQNEFALSNIRKLPQKQWFYDNLNKYARYDQIGTIRTLRKSERIFQYKKKKDDEKWILYTAIHKNAEWKVLLDPNTWEEDETLSFYQPTEDGKLMAYGFAKGGNESPEIVIMNLETGEKLPDIVRGWKQYIASWLPDNSGFIYIANPLKGDVPEGEEYYWSKVYLHKLGATADEDIVVFEDKEVKEKWVYYGYSFDYKYIFMRKGIFYKTAWWLKNPETDEIKTITEDFDAEYEVDYYDGKLYITTNKDAPNYKVYVTDVAHPSPENWKELIQESEAKLQYLNIINSKLYLIYEENVHTKINIHELDGTFIREIKLPMTGSAGIWGEPDGGKIWLYFSSFTYPQTTFNYDFEKDELTVFFAPQIALDYRNMVTKQVWYKSKDGAKIPMFLIHHKDMSPSGNNPTLLYGYGGFNVSSSPYFSTEKALWIEAGGVYAIANIRGGGEFGETWHQAGMKEKKQNVFDDFIAAAEWLIDNHITSKEKLVVYGGSNGGLLIGAIVTQRPDLMKAALCTVPLLDMIRYHHSSIANIWAEEYGSAENPEEFEYIFKYSPYHHIRKGENYPAMLITTGINDARVDPFHARKFTAKLQELNGSSNPIFLLVRDSSGHGGGTTTNILFEQRSEEMAFLMEQLGMD